MGLDWCRTTSVPIFLVSWLTVVGSVRVISRQDGDIMLGALFPIHAKGSSLEGCGSLQVSLAFDLILVISSIFVDFLSMRLLW